MYYTCVVSSFYTTLTLTLTGLMGGSSSSHVLNARWSRLYIEPRTSSSAKISERRFKNTSPGTAGRQDHLLSPLSQLPRRRRARTEASSSARAYLSLVRTDNDMVVDSPSCMDPGRSANATVGDAADGGW